MYNKAQRAQYNQYRENVMLEYKMSEKEYNILRMYANKLHKLFGLSCNGEIEEQDYDNQCKAIENKIWIELTGIADYYYIQTDPRGGTLYISNNVLDEQNYNRGTLIY